MLNEALRLTREFHNLSQTKLAEKLAISKSYLSEIESGKKTPTLELLDKYSEIFDVPKSSLLLFSENIENNTFIEKSRIKVAKKIVNIMNWIADTKSVSDESKSNAA